MSDLATLQRDLAQRLIAPTHLSGNSAHSLEGLDLVELAGFTESLFRKRKSQIRQMLPRTVAALGSDYGRIASSFLVKHHFNGVQAPLRDAVAFSRWLRTQANVPTWLRQLARWEAMTCEWNLHRYYVRFRSYSFDFPGPPSIVEAPRNSFQLWLIVRLNRRGWIRRIF